MSISQIQSLPVPVVSSPSRSGLDWAVASKIGVLKIASYLTEPVCKVREYFYSFYILNETCQRTAQKVVQAVLLTLGIVACALLTPFTTPVGMALRGLVTTFESVPYVYLEGAGQGKILPPDRKMTLVTHNQCYIPAGYSITDGQVIPVSGLSYSKERMDANIRKIKELNPDVVCLYEVADVCDAQYISSQLSEYPFVIPVAGVGTIGPSSMMYVASRYEIAKESIEFVPFVKGTELTGRARFSEKGVLSFDLKSRGETAPFATVISTHLQHSEIPIKPEEGEKKARAAQMNKIAQQIKTKVGNGQTVIFTGDLNQEEEELDAFLSLHKIDWLRRDPAVRGKPTWGGDRWCAELTGRPASPPLVLDYAFVAGKGTTLSTQVIGTGYSGDEFRPAAGSDHDLLFNVVTI